MKTTKTSVKPGNPKLLRTTAAITTILALSSSPISNAQTNTEIKTVMSEASSLISYVRTNTEINVATKIGFELEAAGMYKSVGLTSEWVRTSELAAQTAANCRKNPDNSIAESIYDNIGEASKAQELRKRDQADKMMERLWIAALSVIFATFIVLRKRRNLNLFHGN